MGGQGQGLGGWGLDMNVCVVSLFNPVAPYRYLLPTVYLSVADIENPDLLACDCQTWISLDIARFKRSSATHPTGPHDQLGRKR